MVITSCCCTIPNQTLLVKIVSYEQLRHLVSVSSLPFLTHPVGNVSVSPFGFQLHHSRQSGFGSQPQSFLARAELTIKVIAGSLCFVKLKTKRKRLHIYDLNGYYTPHIYIIYASYTWLIKYLSSKMAALAWRDKGFFSVGSKLLAPAVGSSSGVLWSSVFLSESVFPSGSFGFWAGVIGDGTGVSGSVRSIERLSGSSGFQNVQCMTHMRMFMRWENLIKFSWSSLQVGMTSELGVGLWLVGLWDVRASDSSCSVALAHLTR